MNHWHDVERGSKIPDEFNCIVEIPKDSMNKYELDKKTGLLKLDRVLYSPVHYPGNYGFVPKTYWEDEDPLDVLILGTTSIAPLTIVKVRPLGILNMIDNLSEDDKIIAVPVNDPRYKDIKEVKDLPNHMMNEVKHFFRIYKELQDELVKVLNVKGKKEAMKAIMHGCNLYDKKFLKS